MKTPLRAAAAAAALLSLALLAGCGGQDATKSAATGGATSGAWTQQGLPDALPAPATVHGVSGYAPGGKPRTSMQPAQSVAANPKKCKAQLEAYRKTDATNPTATASYAGQGSAPMFNLAVAGWPTAAKAEANLAAADKLEKCSQPSKETARSTQDGVSVTRYLTNGSDKTSWTLARFASGSAQGSMLCLAQQPAQRKVCNQALKAATKKLAATKPH